MARPSPLPPVRRLRDFSARQKRSKTCGRLSGAMPVPVSATVKDHGVDVLTRGQRDGASGGRVAQGVGDQVAEHLPHANLIGVQPLATVSLGAQGDVLGDQHVCTHAAHPGRQWASEAASPMTITGCRAGSNASSNSFMCSSEMLTQPCVGPPWSTCSQMPPPRLAPSGRAESSGDVPGCRLQLIAIT